MNIIAGIVVIALLGILAGSVLLTIKWVTKKVNTLNEEE